MTCIIKVQVLFLSIYFQSYGFRTVILLKRLIASAISWINADDLKLRSSLRLIGDLLANAITLYPFFPWSRGITIV